MKHVLGYGLLTVALVGAVVVGCRHDIKAGPAPGRVPLIAITPGTSGTDFGILLTEKHKKDTNDLNPHITDHPEDIGDSSKLQTFTWEFTGPFEIDFIPDPSLPAPPHGPYGPCTSDTIISRQTSPYTAKCQLNNWTKGKYYYHVKPGLQTSPSIKNGLPTCDGCFVQIEDPNNPSQ